MTDLQGRLIPLINETRRSLIMVRNNTQKGVFCSICLAITMFCSVLSAQTTIKTPKYVDPIIPESVQFVLDNGLNPYSDIVPSGMSIANRKLYRQAFGELSRQRSFYDFESSDAQGFARSIKGQASQNVVSKTAWINAIGRGGEFSSILPVDKYDLESYGFQAGATLFSTKCNSLGVMFGYERGFYRNRYDMNSYIPSIKQDITSLTESYYQTVYPAEEYNVYVNDFEVSPFRQESNSTRFDDYYLGLYYSHFFDDNHEFRTFIGGGHQRYKTRRNDQKHHYETTYDGASFALNFEFARYYKAQRSGILFRPYIGMDIEHGYLESAMENEVGNLFRFYDRSYLSQLFVRFGLDIEKRWRRVDLHGGVGYTGLLIGKRQVNGVALYPALDEGTAVGNSGARLGRNSINLKAGTNLYLNTARTQSIYVQYVADLHWDRAEDTSLHTFWVGYVVRF